MSEENTFKTENIKHERNVSASGIFLLFKSVYIFVVY